MDSSSPDWIAAISSAAKKTPEDLDWEGAIHSLVEVLEKAPGLTEEQQAVIVGAAALMYQQGFREFQAGRRSGELMQRIMKGRIDR